MRGVLRSVLVIEHEFLGILGDVDVIAHPRVLTQFRAPTRPFLVTRLFQVIGFTRLLDVIGFSGTFDAVDVAGSISLRHLQGLIHLIEPIGHGRSEKGQLGPDTRHAFTELGNLRFCRGPSLLLLTLEGLGLGIGLLHYPFGLASCVGDYLIRRLLRRNQSPAHCTLVRYLTPTCRLYTDRRSSLLGSC